MTDVYEKERSNGGKLEFYVTETEWNDAETGDPVCTIDLHARDQRPPPEVGRHQAIPSRKLRTRDTVVPGLSPAAW